MEPIYTADKTTAAYQLNWSLALFGKSDLSDQSAWLEELQAATEADGVRILSANARSENTIQFLASTRPESSPSDIVRSVKGRLQYLIRDQNPKAFRRNYHIQSVGEANSNVLDQYVAGQTAKHPIADDAVQARIEAAQFHDESVDLSKTSIGTYGKYLNSLQVVVENAESWHEVRDSQLQRVRRVIVRACEKKPWRLSRIGLLSNHVHVLLGADVTDSPQSVALSLMNNIAHVYEMKPILKFSYYVGTFGGYDRGVVRKLES
ncbi:Transposase IS200 like protein [Rubripirellula obstinata]|uniref:Transposase IS200 like protein n=1 Tax=Rubripirellula obstinata TaxID=406547 RepID=A0A5B1CKX3_9BACT|nr:transposase [Rubripirellula obstinata]KAA1261196.1 Transposase IS200 like protein [Rubripirellula obstinata]